MPRIGLFLGHSILKNGACTSADGRKYGGCLEYAFNKKLIKDLQEYLEGYTGFDVKVIKCPEGQFTSSTQERDYKLMKANSGKYDLILELHLNASYNKKAEGAEVLYYPSSMKGKKAAACIQAELSKIFKDRGIRGRSDLYMLKRTIPVALIVESFFCTSEADYKKANSSAERKKIAEAIGRGVYNYF